MTQATETAAPLTDVTRRVLDLIEGHLPQLTSPPDQAVRHFAAAGLVRCCAFLRGIMALESAGLTVLTTGLARQHWETWLVSLHVVLGRDEALQEVGGDDIHWKRKLADSLRLGIRYHVDWGGPEGKLRYDRIYNRVVTALEQAGEPPIDGDGISGYHVSYATPSLFGAHANMTTICAHIRYEPDRWSLVSIPEPPFPDVLLTPAMHTVHLGQYVFKEFGLDPAPFDALGDELLAIGQGEQGDSGQPT